MKTKTKTKKIVVLGGGYVGLDLSIALSKKFTVNCFDINKHRIKRLKLGHDDNNQHSPKYILNKKLIFHSSEYLIQDADFYICTVPTPINKFKIPDLSMLKNSSKLIGKLIKKKSVIIFESTTFPGCTEEICIPIVEKFSNLKFGKDFEVAYSPERVNPGDKVNVLKNITKIVGANEKKTLEKVKNLYKHICNKVYTVNSIKIAESAKVIENIQRDTNIALINELSILFNKMQIPTQEILKAASTKWNFHYYKPGLVGGHCISVDPYYLAYKAKKMKFHSNLILSGRKVNEFMPKYVANQTYKLLKKYNNEKKIFKLAILGFAFKENIPDIRNTKIFDYIKFIKKKGISFDIFDPIVNKIEVKKKYNLVINDIKDLKVKKYDCIVLAVSHKIFLNKIKIFNKVFKKNAVKIFIDIKNNYSDIVLNDNGFKYFKL